MTRSNKDKTHNASLNSKMDKLLEKFTTVEEKLDARMKNLETGLGNVEIKIQKHEKENKKMCTEITNLQAIVNGLEQDKLECDVIIQGIPEHEDDTVDILQILHYFFNTMGCSLGQTDILSAYRIGKNQRNGRNILVKFRSVNTKKIVMEKKKKLNIHRAMFSTNNVEWGNEQQGIFINDNLTAENATIYFHARKLKQIKKMKYVWTKMGKIYVKKDDGDRAIQVKSVKQILSIQKQLGVKTVLSSTRKSEEGSESTESESDDTSSENGTPEKVTNKRNQSDETSLRRKAPIAKRNRQI